jgi:hypothetical protein
VGGGGADAWPEPPPPSRKGTHNACTKATHGFCSLHRQGGGKENHVPISGLQVLISKKSSAGGRSEQQSQGVVQFPSTRQCHTKPHRTAPHRTAPHRTAPHRTAPHRTEGQRRRWARPPQTRCRKTRRGAAGQSTAPARPPRAPQTADAAGSACGTKYTQVNRFMTRFVEESTSRRPRMSSHSCRPGARPRLLPVPHPRSTQTRRARRQGSRTLSQGRRAQCQNDGVRIRARSWL